MRIVRKKTMTAPTTATATRMQHPQWISLPVEMPGRTAEFSCTHATGRDPAEGLLIRQQQAGAEARGPAEIVPAGPSLSGASTSAPGRGRALGRAAASLKQPSA